MAEIENKYLLERWQYAHDSRKKHWEDVARQAYNYYTGTGHWTAAEAALLAKENRPDSKLNYIFKWMNVVTGNERQNRNDLWIYPTEGGDVRMASVYNFIFKYIKKQNNLDWLMSQAALDSFLTGQGWIKLYIEVDDEFEAQIKAKVINPFLMNFDPDSIEYDLSDAKDIFEAQWLDKDMLKKAYSRKIGDKIDSWYSSAKKSREKDLYINEQKNLLRVLDCYYRDYRIKNYWFDEKTGSITQDEKAGYRRISKLVSRIKFRRLFGDVTLEEMEAPLGLEKDFPYVSIFAYFVKGVGVPLCEQVISIQDIINKSYSQFMDLLNRQPKPGIMYEEGAVDDESVFEDYRNGKITQVPAGTISGNRIKIGDPPVYPAAHAATLQNAVQMGEDILSITQAFQGQAPGRIESALGVERLIQQSEIPHNLSADNIHLSQVLMGRKILQLVNNFWGLKKTLRLLGEEADLIDVEINPAEITVTNIDKISGETIKVETFPNILDKGKYDFTIDTNKPSITNRQWNVFFALEIAKMISDPMLQIKFLSMVIDMTDFPRKEEFKQTIQEAAQSGMGMQPGQMEDLGQAIQQGGA